MGWVIYGNEAIASAERAICSRCLSSRDIVKSCCLKLYGQMLSKFIYSYHSIPCFPARVTCHPSMHALLALLFLIMNLTNHIHLHFLHLPLKDNCLPQHDGLYMYCICISLSFTTCSIYKKLRLIEQRILLSI